MLHQLEKEDTRRIKAAARKVVGKARVQRQKLRSMKKAKIDSTNYIPGGFGLGSNPEEGPSKKRKRKTNQMTKSKKSAPNKNIVKYVVSFVEDVTDSAAPVGVVVTDDTADDNVKNIEVTFIDENYIVISMLQ